MELIKKEILSFRKEELITVRYNGQDYIVNDWCFDESNLPYGQFDSDRDILDQKSKEQFEKLSEEEQEDFWDEFNELDKD